MHPWTLWPRNISHVRATISPWLAPTHKGAGSCGVFLMCPYYARLQVNLSAPVTNTSCWDQPTLVPAASHKVDLFNGRLSGTLLTSIFVTVLQNVTVAHLGTAQGRVLQVGAGQGAQRRAEHTVPLGCPMCSPHACPTADGAAALQLLRGRPDQLLSGGAGTGAARHGAAGTLAALCCRHQGKPGSGAGCGAAEPPAQCRSASPGVACERHRPWLPPLLHL